MKRTKSSVKKVKNDESEKEQPTTSTPKTTNKRRVTTNKSTKKSENESNDLKSGKNDSVELSEFLSAPPIIPTENSQSKNDVEVLEWFETNEKTDLLPLPNKFRVIERIFNAILQTVMLLKERRQACLWENLKPPVEAMCNRILEESHIGILMAVCPNIFVVERRTIGSQSQLAIELNKQVFDMGSEHKVFIVELRKNFHNALLDRVKQLHSDFLNSTKKGRGAKKESDVDINLSGWHPNFDLEKVPDFVPIKLPEEFSDLPSHSKKRPIENNDSNDDNGKKTKTSKDSESRIDSLLLGKVKVPLKTINQETNEGKLAEGDLAGIDQSLILKSRVLSVRHLSSIPVCDSLRLIGNMPKFCSLMRSFYNTENRKSMSLDSLVVKIVGAYQTPISLKEGEDIIRLISSTLNDWCKLLDVDGVTWVKLNSTLDFRDILKRVKIEIDKAISINSNDNNNDNNNTNNDNDNDNDNI